MSVKNLLLQPALKDLMKDPAGKLNLLNVGFTAISDSGNLRQNKYQKELPTLSQTINIFNQALQVSLEEMVWLVF